MKRSVGHKFPREGEPVSLGASPAQFTIQNGMERRLLTFLRVSARAKRSRLAPQRLSIAPLNTNAWLNAGASPASWVSVRMMAVRVRLVGWADGWFAIEMMPSKQITVGRDIGLTSDEKLAYCASNAGVTHRKD